MPCRTLASTLLRRGSRNGGRKCQPSSTSSPLRSLASSSTPQPKELPAAAALAAQEAREDAMWLSKPTHSQLLQPPPHGAAPATAATTLETYLAQRGWTTPLATPGLRILSHLLSYPLTLAHYLPHLLPADSQEQQEQHLAILGARAEATLPAVWWKESLGLRAAHAHLRMQGPETPATAKPEHLVLDDTRQLWLQYEQGLYHQLPTSNPSAEIILFNPGLGHPHLAASWAPTLAKLQAEQKTVLWTAHSPQDRDRDVALLETQAKVEWIVAPEPNPFCSRKKVVDPLDATHVLAANQVAGVFKFV